MNVLMSCWKHDMEFWSPEKFKNVRDVKDEDEDDLLLPRKLPSRYVLGRGRSLNLGRGHRKTVFDAHLQLLNKGAG